LSQNSAVTPQVYAQIVQQYTSAIRGVDPTAPMIGLPGTGSGGSTEAQWIQATVALNGKNLSAIATHIYPAVPITPGEAASKIYGTLTGSNSVPARIQTDLAALSSACASCRLKLLVDELGAGTQGSPGSYFGGYSLVPYVAAELTQGIATNVTTLDYFTLQLRNSPVGWFTSNSPNPVYSLFTTFVPRFPTTIFGTAIAASSSNAFVLAGQGAAPSLNATLVVVNANPVNALRVNLSSTKFPTNVSGSSVWWNGGLSSPQLQNWPGGVPPIWVIPPLGVGLWSAAGQFGPRIATLSHSSISVDGMGELEVHPTRADMTVLILSSQAPNSGNLVGAARLRACGS
jgi:hypothetical protein